MEKFQSRGSNLNKPKTTDSFTSKKGERNLMYSMPVLPKGYKTEVDIFPTYPNQSTPYYLICEKSNFNGEQLSTKEIEISKLSPFCQFAEKGDDLSMDGGKLSGE